MPPHMQVALLRSGNVQGGREIKQAIRNGTLDIVSFRRVTNFRSGRIGVPSINRDLFQDGTAITTMRQNK